MKTKSAVLASVVLLCSLLIPEPVSADRGKLARKLLQRAGMQRGVCSVVRADQDLALQLAQNSELLVHLRAAKRSEVVDTLRAAQASSLGIDRLTGDSGSLKQLPYADNMIDVLICTQWANQPDQAPALAEVLRVLRPQGTAIIGQVKGRQNSTLSAEKLQQWAKEAGAEKVASWSDEDGVWVQFFCPARKGVDEWSHWEKSPDNNPVSSDSVIKAPYMTQFMATPYYIGMPSITTAAGGRTFLAIGHIAHHRREWNTLNKLVARNGYNGTILWQRPLPDGYLVHRSAFVASRDTLYMIDKNSCLMLDARTGDEKGRIRIPGVTGEWKWMVLVDNTLFVMAGKKSVPAEIVRGDRSFGGWSWADLSKGYYGKRIPHGFGDTLAAYDLQKMETRWTVKEKDPIDSRGLAIRDGKLYYYCPDKRFGAVDTRTGKVLWTNDDKKLIQLVEQPGKGLTSTPGWRTQTLVVATPKSLIVQGQTRMNVVAISTEDGYLRWTKKVTNNPNAIYLDDKVILGVGPRGTHVSIDPVSGKIIDNLGFRKAACTRLTACVDSLFCRGEGTLRFDRKTKQVLVDGGQRPGCNDGAMPAHGLLYLGPWQCDCNLSLIGNIAKCSAGEFRFDVKADESRLEKFAKFSGQLATAETDWPTYRGDNARGSRSRAALGKAVARRWAFLPDAEFTPSAATAAGKLLFVAGDDGCVRAIDHSTGKMVWKVSTSGPIKYPPTIWNGRAYVGSADGFMYCLEARTGRVLWRFRGAPVERQIMVYGRLSSTWPVHSGVLIHDGVAYFAAGIVDHDGTYLYAVDADSGDLVWENHATGHLNQQLRKGVSVQGNLTINGDRLLLASGNQISPAPFDLKTGKYLGKSFEHGRPKANGGRFVGVLNNAAVIQGGRILHSAAQNVSTKGSFAVYTRNTKYAFTYGGVPPAWNEDTMAFVNFKHGKLTCCDAAKAAAQITTGMPAGRPSDRQRRSNIARLLENEKVIRWQTDLGEPTKFEVVSLAVCPNAVVAVVRLQLKVRSQPQWFVIGLDGKSGRPLFRQELRIEPLPGGLLIDGQGQIIVNGLAGEMLCFAGKSE